MTKFEKTTVILLAIMISLSITLGGLVLYLHYQNQKEQSALIEKQTVKQKELEDNITRSSSEFATKKDLESLIKSNKLNLDVLQKDLDKLDASIKAVNTVTVVSQGYTNSNLPSTSTGIKNPDSQPQQFLYQDPYNYFKLQQKLTISEKFSNQEIPFGEVGFSAWQEKPWEVTVHPRQYKISTVLATDENNRHFAYNKFFISSNNKDYEVKIDKAELVEQVPSNQWFFWNPKLFFGISAGYGTNKTTDVNVFGSFNFINYGKFKNKPLWTILSVGPTYSLTQNDLGIIVSPIQYSLGNHFEMLSNTYISPNVSFYKDRVTFGLGTEFSF